LPGVVSWSADGGGQDAATASEACRVHFHTIREDLREKGMMNTGTHVHGHKQEKGGE
jgi:hypothetical protein